MDPLMFMLALLSMTETEYQLCRNGIPYAQSVTNELDYDEFNDTHLMPSLTPKACALPLLIHFHFSFVQCQCPALIGAKNRRRWAFIRPPTVVTL